MDFVDEITITGIRAYGFHGVYPDEKRDGQEFIVDAQLFISTARAAETDDVADTVHYGELAEAIAGIVSGDPVDLIETLASRIADAVLAHDLVEMTRITVHKPSAPIPVPFADVAVTVNRTKVAR